MFNKLTQKDAYKLLHNGILALAKAERQGIRIDMDYVLSKRDELSEMIEKLTGEFKQSDFYEHWQRSSDGYRNDGRAVNINSNPQLAHFLYKIKKFQPVKTTPSGQGSTDEEALEALGVEELDALLRIRKLKKLRDTYLEGFIREAVDGCIHPFFNLHTVRSYRSSSDSPNFQNIPVRDEESQAMIRQALLPRPGHRLLEVDYKALEVCIGACYHKDPTMLEYINDPASDMHADMAKQIFFIDKLDYLKPVIKTLRNAAKNGFVFPQFYGDYYGNNALGICRWVGLPVRGRWHDDSGMKWPGGDHIGGHLRRNGIPSLEAFKRHLEKIEHHFWNERFPVYDRWKRRWFRQYQRKGYFEMLTGFRCSGVMGFNDVVNYPIQGSAFHCLLWSFIELDKWLQQEQLDTRIIGQIHDSILLDVAPLEFDYVLKKVQQITCADLRREWLWIVTPLAIKAEACEVDESWYYKKPVKIST